MKLYMITAHEYAIVTCNFTFIPLNKECIIARLDNYAYLKSRGAFEKFAVSTETAYWVHMLTSDGIIGYVRTSVFQTFDSLNEKLCSTSTSNTVPLF